MAGVESFYAKRGASTEFLTQFTFRSENNEKMSQSPWKNSIIYQAYPSVITSSPDGQKMPFLKNLNSSLSYIKSLGTDAIWLSPIYPSSGADSGYDITDYCSIDPKYGTMDDFENLVENARDMNMSIFMDLVFNHVSQEHPWFQTGSISKDDPYHDWFLFRNENNPLIKSKWTKDQPLLRYIESTKEYVLGSFSHMQIDLNLRNKNVQDRLLQVIDFWKSKGLGGKEDIRGGFRLDVADSYDKDDSFYDPALPIDVMSSIKKGPKLFSQDGFLSRLSTYVDQSDALVLEVGEDLPDPNYIKLFQEIGINTIPFVFIHELPWQANSYKHYLDKLGTIVDLGRICLQSGSHDISRLHSRLNAAKADANWVMLSMLGTVLSIYNGDDLGMVDQELPGNGFIDPLGRYKSRGEIQWDVLRRAETKERLHKLRILMELKKNLSVLQSGKYVPAESGNDNIFAYTLVNDSQSILVATNFSDQEQIIKTPIANGKVLYSTHDIPQFNFIQNNLKLKPNEALVIDTTYPL